MASVERVTRPFLYTSMNNTLHLHTSVSMLQHTYAIKWFTQTPFVLLQKTCSNKFILFDPEAQTHFLHVTERLVFELNSDVAARAGGSARSARQPQTSALIRPTCCTVTHEMSLYGKAGLSIKDQVADARIKHMAIKINPTMQHLSPTPTCFSAPMSDQLWGKSTSWCRVTLMIPPSGD